MQIPELTFESKWVLKAISHEIRQKILILIQENSVQTYTDLMQKLSLSTGKLNFHLKQMTGLLEKQEDGSYILSSIGKKAFDILKQVHTIGEAKEHIDYFKALTLGKSLRQFEPASEIKKKWYFLINIIYCLFIWLPVIIIESVIDFKFLNILNASERYIRILTYNGIITGIILTLIISSLLLAKKYLESISYEILDTEITIIKGFIVKTKTIIPFRTITNLVIRQGPLDLILGISTVIIQTAGESAKKEPEGKLIGVYYAADLIEEILNLVRLLDPPSYLKEKIAFSFSRNTIPIYSQMLEELQEINEKLNE
ncbi:MAG: PH domain-containing protein [Candidatus Thorarchaeota archaeon]